MSKRFKSNSFDDVQHRTEEESYIFQQQIIQEHTTINSEEEYNKLQEILLQDLPKKDLIDIIKRLQYLNRNTTFIPSKNIGYIPGWKYGVISTSMRGDCGYYKIIKYNVF
jgi:hypothetical protein